MDDEPAGEIGEKREFNDLGLAHQVLALIATYPGMYGDEEIFGFYGFDPHDPLLDKQVDTIGNALAESGWVEKYTSEDEKVPVWGFGDPGLGVSVLIEVGDSVKYKISDEGVEELGSIDMNTVREEVDKRKTQELVDAINQFGVGAVVEWLQLVIEDIVERRLNN